MAAALVLFSALERASLYYTPAVTVLVGGALLAQGMEQAALVEPEYHAHKLALAQAKNPLCVRCATPLNVASTTAIQKAPEVGRIYHDGSRG